MINRLRLPLRRYSRLLYPTLRTTATRTFSTTFTRFDQTFQSQDHVAAHELPALASNLSIGPPSASVFTPFATCPGCGAYAQTLEHNEAGFYTTKRNAVRAFLGLRAETFHRNIDEDEIYQQAIQNATPEVRDALTSSAEQQQPPQPDLTIPLCDRCHDLLHHSSGVPVHHPPMSAIREIISETPYKYNHVYHVLDAADFPMSLIPNIHRILSLAPQRPGNRRSKHAGYKHGKKAELSFIINRSDLLAPRKEQVDRLMPYLVQVLRDALKWTGKDVRLGNVKCVSAKRGWWTRGLKADIWERGGAGWMVGKVNVGKSNLFEVAFPKGSAQDISFERLRNESKSITIQPYEEALEEEINDPLPDEDFDPDNASLLPPARQETPFPNMPTVSALPGTTASPIRIPFGNGRGELIDLPGLFRSNIENYVQPDKKSELLMKSRVAAEQITIKPGQSLLIDGLIRITPMNNDQIILANPFVPLKTHLTSTEKASDPEGKTSPASKLALDGLQQKLQSAGRFQLKWDVTRARAGPLTARDAAALKPHNLAFKVLSIDILIESVGWVELTTQVRRRDFPVDASQLTDGDNAVFPEVEIFSPGGNFIGSREPMGAWLLGGQKPLAKSQRKSRPRPNMSRLKGSRAAAATAAGANT